jgi:hypothetical protein
MNMKDILKRHCLVLNKSWVPCNTILIKKAISKVLNERAIIIHPTTFASYSFENWIKKDNERLGEEVLTSGKGTYDIPTIISAVYYTGLHVKYTPLNHQNIYKRDNFRCAYCRSKDNLTWDHIVPEFKKGKSSWTNLVTSCKSCNNKKDRMDVDEFCQIMNCEIPKPISLASTPWLLGRAVLRPEWKNFIKGG